MIIAIDIDDVLADTCNSILNFYNERYGKNITKSELNDLPYLGFLGATKDEASKRLFEFNDTGKTAEILPVKGAVEAIKQLASKHKLVIVTSRPIELKEATIHWLNKYFPGSFGEVHFNNDHSREEYLPGMGQKGDLCEEIGASVLIEDLLKYANNTSPNTKVVLIDKPWNKGDILDNVFRAKDWAETVRYIENLD